MNEKIVQICREKLTNLNYAQNTVDSYMRYITLFVYLQDKRYKNFNSTDFNDFLKNYPYTSVSQQDQVISALKLFYVKVLGKSYGKVDFDRPRKGKALPKIVDGNRLLDRINSIKNLKHRAILSLAYDTGMRASELLNLKIEHCDKDRMRFRVVNSKGNKSREIPMSSQIRILLREYYIDIKPEKYIFNGQNSLQYSYSSLLKMCKSKVGVEPHIIRHTYASELLRKGVNLRVIQRLLGHSTIKTTEIYTHVVDRDLDNVPSLLSN